MFDLRLFPEFAPVEDGGDNEQVADGEGNEKPDGNESESGSSDEGVKDKNDSSDKKKKPTLEDFENLQKENKKLTEKLGKQGKTLGEKSKVFDDLKNKMDNETTDFIKALAKNKGINLNFDAPKDPYEDLMSGDEERAKAALNRINERKKEDAIRDKIMAEISPGLRAVQEQSLASKYPDFDAMAESREQVKLSVAAGVMTETELLHHASRGLNLSGAIEEAKKEAVAEYISSLKKKSDASVGVGGGSTPKKTTDNANMGDFLTTIGIGTNRK